MLVLYCRNYGKAVWAKAVFGRARDFGSAVHCNAIHLVRVCPGGLHWLKLPGSQPPANCEGEDEDWHRAVDPLFLIARMARCDN